MGDQSPRVVVITGASQGIGASLVPAYDGLGTLHPMGRMGETSDVVSAIMYLESAPFVTGEFMHVDGGQSAGH
jgi:NAD(P)-dependent dehydrogenase (short-subunit alcohol dehydrogenase family)